MVKHIKKVTKRRPTRERKRIIVVGAEGNNKSEIQYFHELEKKQNKPKERRKTDKQNKYRNRR